MSRGSVETMIAVFAVISGWFLRVLWDVWADGRPVVNLLAMAAVVLVLQAMTWNERRKPPRDR